MLDPDGSRRPWIVLGEDRHREQARPGGANLEIPLGATPGQAMLAPKIEARMLQELGLKAMTVLKIGAGSGYMAALLA